MYKLQRLNQVKIAKDESQVKKLKDQGFKLMKDKKKKNNNKRGKDNPPAIDNVDSSINQDPNTEVENKEEGSK